MDEGGGPDLHSVRARAAVADEEETQLALRRFGRTVRLTLGRLEALRKNDEVVYEALHVPHDLLFWRWDDLGNIRDDGRVGHLGQAWAGDAGALAYLLHADAVPVVCVAVLAERDFTLHF